MGTAFRCVLACLFVCIASGSAAADAAAARAAFEKGDYASAMSEWQQAADHDDGDAEFGLGQLYEFGMGDLAQNYKRADYWYRKAAGHEQSEAEYRLALIWSAGTEDFPPNLVEAYQWAVLAAASRGVWGSLAADLKAQIEAAITPEQQADGRRRAASWKTTASAPPPPPTPVPSAVVAVAPVAVPAGRSAPTKAGGGCPGWPFPTLPCTLQFPALPGVAPPRPPPKPSIDSQPGASR